MRKPAPMLWEALFLNSIAGGGLPAAGQALNLPAASLTVETPMDSDEFAAFYSRAARPLWAYLARVSADPALADDLMQESFVRFLCAARPAFSAAGGEVEARRYLFRIGTNLLRDHWRRPTPSSLDEVPEELLAHPDRSAQAGSEDLLGPALRQVRPRERQLLWLAYAEGYSHHEIAQITGLASASIRLLLFRARRKIARILTMQAAPRKPQVHAEARQTEPQPDVAFRSRP